MALTFMADAGTPDDYEAQRRARIERNKAFLQKLEAYACTLSSPVFHRLDGEEIVRY